MVDFLLLIEEIPYYTKKDIDLGLIPNEIYRLCSCIRETFCLSYSIRKQNNLFLFFYNNLNIIKFQGNRLRFLSSDERSQALLLNKAINKFNEINMKITDKWIKSTAGIFIRRFDDLQEFQNFIKQISQRKIILINNHDKEYFLLNHKKFIDLKDLNEYLYTLLIFNNTSKASNLIDLLKESGDLKFVKLPQIKDNENKILYINFLIDQRNIS